ncbi:MAG: hypothetical protein AAFY26_27185 [Cyanobacteria bacterium J06638_22]
MHSHPLLVLPRATALWGEATSGLPHGFVVDLQELLEARGHIHVEHRGENVDKAVREQHGCFQAMGVSVYLDAVA